MGVETRYLKIEKLAYGLLIAVRKLCYYFQAHPIVVLIDQPLKHILQRLKTSGRLLKWSIELSEFHLDFKPRMAIKGQALADFVTKFTCDIASEFEKGLHEVKTTKQSDADNLSRCKLVVDGS